MNKIHAKTETIHHTCSDSFAFNKTVIAVNLAQYGKEKLISRSQAKWVLNRVELFEVVVFDFIHVEVFSIFFI